MNKQMEYSKHRHYEVLAKGKKGKYYWCIISLGTHPCCYVYIPKGHKYYKKDYNDVNINCHGGLTFGRKDLDYNPIVIKDSWVIGWDFAHSTDYMGYFEKGHPLFDGKKWTTEELIKEVDSVIKQLQKVRKK